MFPLKEELYADGQEPTLAEQEEDQAATVNGDIGMVYSSTQQELTQDGGCVEGGGSQKDGEQAMGGSTAMVAQHNDTQQEEDMDQNAAYTVRTAAYRGKKGRYRKRKP